MKHSNSRTCAKAIHSKLSRVVNFTVEIPHYNQPVHFILHIHMGTHKHTGMKLLLLLIVLQCCCEVN